MNFYRKIVYKTDKRPIKKKGDNMATLVTYFSASGVTKRVAEKVADALDADIFEIAPETPYTAADLNYMDKDSRSTIEMNDVIQTSNQGNN